jgi:uncharacterized protein (DUF488 family)
MGASIDPVVYSLGHSSHCWRHFVDLLRQHRLTAVADLRTAPYSRHAPHFGKRDLERALAAAGVGYHFLGRELGGRPRLGQAEQRAFWAGGPLAEDFQHGIERLIGLANGARLTMLCAEEDPARCHRRLLVAPALRARGIRVVHIRGDGRLVDDRELDHKQLTLL